MDTSITFMSSRATSVSTEYVSLNSAGASYHTLGTVNQNEPCHTLEQTYRGGPSYRTLGINSRTNNSERTGIKKASNHQISESKYYISKGNQGEMLYEHSDSQSLPGALLDPRMYQINSGKQNTGGIVNTYYHSPENRYMSSENIHNTTQNTDAYTEQGSYNMDQYQGHYNENPCHDSSGRSHLLESPPQAVATYGAQFILPHLSHTCVLIPFTG